MASTLLTPSAVSRMAWIRIGLGRRVLGLELGQQLVEVVDVPGPLDLGQHDHVELGADRRHDLQDVVERPGRVEAVDARPQPGLAEVVCPGHVDEARAARLPWRRRGWRPRGCRARRRPAPIMSRSLARIFSLCGGTKWIMRSSSHGELPEGLRRADGKGRVMLGGRACGGHGGRPLLRCNNMPLRASRAAVKCRA